MRSECAVVISATLTCSSVCLQDPSKYTAQLIDLTKVIVSNSEKPAAGLHLVPPL